MAHHGGIDENIITVVICASIEGMLNSTISSSFSRPVSWAPLRIFARRVSLFLLLNIGAKVLTKQQSAKAKQGFFA